MQTIKDKELKHKVDNIINKVLFAKFYRPFLVEKDEKETEEVNLVFDTLNTLKKNDDDNILNGGLTDNLLRDFGSYMTQKEQKDASRLKAFELEDRLLEEIQANFNEDANEYRTYNVDYFNDRMVIFEISGFTDDFTKEEIALQEAVGFVKPKTVN